LGGAGGQSQPGEVFGPLKEVGMGGREGRRGGRGPVDGVEGAVMLSAEKAIGGRRVFGIGGDGELLLAAPWGGIHRMRCLRKCLRTIRERCDHEEARVWGKEGKSFETWRCGGTKPERCDQ